MGHGNKCGLLAFVDRYNLTARPFNGKFTASDLLRRISEREQQATTQQTDLAEAADTPTKLRRHAVHKFPNNAPRLPGIAA